MSIPLIKNSTHNKAILFTISDRIRCFLVIVFCLIAVLQSGLRDIENLPITNDTPRFYIRYINILETPWSSLLNKFGFVSSEYSERDSGYEVFMKLTQCVSEDFTFFMFLTAAIFMIPFGMLIYKYIRSYLGVILVFTIYFAIFTNIVNSFMRQAVALGITLFAIRYIISRKWKHYYGLMFIALSIHSSAIAAFPFYFFPMVSTSRKWLLLSFAASPVLIVFQQTLMSYFLTGSVYDRYVSSEMVNPVNYMALIGSISLLSLVFYNDLRQVEDGNILISAVIGIMLLMPVIFMGNTMLRISYYYVYVLILLLPVIIDIVKMPKAAKFLTYLLLISFFVFMIYRK